MSIYSLWNKKDLLLKAQSQLDRAKKENKDLKRQLEVVQNPFYIEEMARTRLFLAKPDEKEIILSLPTPSVPQEQKANIPNWRQWIDLFF